MSLKIIEITSDNNPKFKMLKSLGTRSGRKKTGKFCVEGPESIIEALKAQIIPKEIFISSSFYERDSSKKLLDSLYNHEANIYLLADNLFKKLSFTETPKGIIITVNILQYELEKILKKINNSSLFVMCESIQDPGNLGTIIRSADSAAADAVFLSRGCVDIHNPKTIRASMGSIFNIPVITVDDIGGLINELKCKQVKIFATLPVADKNIFKANLTNALCFLIGNEGQGLTNETVNLSDETVKIPMLGKTESLNASVAGSIFLYEVTRQRLENIL